jgi:hypothetical protein
MEPQYWLNFRGLRQEREPEAEKKILNMVSPVERSYEHIEANTVFYNLDALSALDHLLQSAEARKDSAIKELELYRDRKARRSAIGATFKVNADEEVAHAKLQKG